MIFQKNILLILIGKAKLAEDQTPLPQTEIGNICKKLEQYIREYIKAENEEEKQKFGDAIIKTYAVLADCIIFEEEPDHKEICNRVEKIELEETV
jgi:DNA topoisomerase VI subunit B